MIYQKIEQAQNLKFLKLHLDLWNDKEDFQAG